MCREEKGAGKREGRSVGKRMKRNEGKKMSSNKGNKDSKPPLFLRVIAVISKQSPVLKGYLIANLKFTFIPFVLLMPKF